MRRTLTAVLTLSLVFAGCRLKEAVDKASISKDLDKKGTMDLMKEVADDKYDPPADGKLTDAQVQMYLKVREKEKAIAQVARQEAQEHAKKADAAGQKSIGGFIEGLKTVGSAADMFTADIRAAKELGYNTQEYLWVKAQILAVSSSAIGEKMATAMNASMDQAYNQTKKQYDEAKDEQTKAMLKPMLDQYDQARKEASANKKNDDPAVAYNKQLLSKYEDTLNAYANELAKWEDKPGDAQKAVQDMNKNLDKAVEDTKKSQ